MQHSPADTYSAVAVEAVADNSAAPDSPEFSAVFRAYSGNHKNSTDSQHSVDYPHSHQHSWEEVGIVDYYTP